MTRSAEADRDLIVAYLVGQAKSRSAASRLLDELDRVIDNLSRSPLMHTRVRDSFLAAKGIRKAPVAHYIVLFKVGQGRVCIERIFHQAQDCARLL